MKKFGNNNSIFNKNVQRKSEYEEFAELRKTVNPFSTAVKITILYLTIGSLWILLSDKALNMMVKDDALFKQIQLYKGWFYVFTTGLIFFLIIRRTLLLYKRAVDCVLTGYEDLNSMYEEIIAMNEELDEQNNKLEKQKDALLLSEQRYQIVAEGSSDGIWDWDIINDVYYLSDRWKSEFGYEPEEIGNTMYYWEKLLSPVDWEIAKKALNEYLASGKGVYEATYRVRKKSGEYRWILSRGKGIWDSSGKPVRIAGSHSDITERKMLEEKLLMLAYYDVLTGLPNRIMFEQTISGFIAKNQKLSITILDVDDLKHINDIFGKNIGDQYLKYIASIMSDLVASPDIVANLGGDQFAIVHVIGEKDDTTRKLELLFSQIRIPWKIYEDNIFVSASAGFVLFPEHGSDVETLMKNAEIAMFHQKEKGKNGYTLFDAFMHDETLKIGQMNIELRKAIENEEFLLYYQPQYDLNTAEMIAVESLIRWKHPQRGFIPPMDFIPFSEKTGHIIPISIWVMRTAILQKREWQKKGYRPLRMAINLSGYVIVDKNTIDLICQMLEELKIEPGEIEFEITETALMLDLEIAKESLRRLRAYGISIAIDDFGTGYSSLTYLHTLQFESMKIDREFIKNIKAEDEDSFIYKTVIELAHNLDMMIIAEGIETKEQNDFLLRNNCDIGQGFYYSKPVTADEIERMLAEQEKLD